MNDKKIIVSILLGVIIISCSTQKNTTMSRAYHNLTAHYNVYFNGNESYKSGVKKVRDAVKNDYSEILPLFEYSDKQNVAAASAEMDRAIQKGIKIISKHSITKKPKKKGSDGSAAYKEFYSQKEFNKWVDDAYLLIGKAQFYKHEYNQSVLTFDHVIRDFPNYKTSFESKIRKAASYAEKGDYANARETLDTYEESGNAPLSLKGLYMAVYADLLIKEKKYDEAIPYLQSAIENTSDRWSRTRFQYVLAQICEEVGKKKEAVEAYSQVLKLRPPYEMAFNAQVGKVAIILEGASTYEIKREINKLLKNKKNIEFHDRIYYALANVNLQEGDEKEAIKNLKLSTQSSVGNDKQKAKSFIKLGDIYFNQPAYRLAYEAYDSAIVFLPKGDPQYNTISDKYKSLKLLVDQTDIIEREDSLQRIANMGETERLAYLNKLVEEDRQRKEEEIRRQNEMQDNGSYNDAFGNQSLSTGGNQGGKWYFYNPASVSMGRSEFERRWGKRKLEDNWRRSDKSVVMTNPTDDPGEPGESLTLDLDKANKTDDQQQTTGQDITVESLMKNLPLTDSALIASNEMIEGALLESGIIYRDYFSDFDRSTASFNELLARYKNGLKREDAMIELYQAYYYSGNKDGMDRVRQMITREFPQSRFTAYLNDPEFFAKIEKQKHEREVTYEKTYNNYLNGLYPEVIRVADSQIDDDQADDLLNAKYCLLKSLSFARMGEGEQFRSNLQELIVKHQGTEEAELAAEFMKELDNGRVPVKNSSAQSALFASSNDYSVTITGSDVSGSGGFTSNPQAPHSLVVLVNADADMKRLIYNFADYNFGRFLLNDYDLLTNSLPDKTGLLEVKGFNNQREAVDYFYAVRQTPLLFDVKNVQKPKLFAISDENLKKLISSGDIVGYVSFYVQNYLLSNSEKVSSANDSINVTMSYVQPVSIILSEKKDQQIANVNANQDKGFTSDEAPFKVVIAYDAARINNEKLKTMVIGFNRNNGLSNISSVTITDLSDTRKLLVIDFFETDKDASEYIALIKKSPFVLRDISTKKHELFFIGTNNFDKMLKQKSVDEYLKFSNQVQ